MRGHFTPEGERFVGLAFLDGRSVVDISQTIGCSRHAVESVLRAQMKHLIETKKPPQDDAPLTPDEAVALTREEAILLLRSRGIPVEVKHSPDGNLTDEPQNAHTDGQPAL